MKLSKVIDFCNLVLTSAGLNQEKDISIYGHPLYNLNAQLNVGNEMPRSRK
jgi:hypothetical protein